MCGIVGYIGSDNSTEILLDSLGKLEYRGYDSAGIAYVSGHDLKVIKSSGELYNLKKKVSTDSFSTIGIGHTRWATHGTPSELNAHPHIDCTGKIAVVHNGIIENYTELKDQLVALGHRFVSETDTEVISHLIEEYYTDDMERALRDAVKRIRGSFAIAVINRDDPARIFAAKMDSPIVIGVGDLRYFLASDVTAFVKYTRRAIFLEDGDIAVISKDGLVITDFDGTGVAREVRTIDWNVDAVEKAGYEHFMLKEIHEQSRSIMDSFSGRISEMTGEVILGEVSLTREQVMDLRRIVIVACGTSYHAGMIGKYAMDGLVRIPASVEIGSEFRYSSSFPERETLVIALSQSGETADTISTVKDMARKGIHVIAVTNMPGSTITREANDTIYMGVGPEIGVAATKTFTAQVVIMYLLALYLGRMRGNIGATEARPIIAALKGLPQKVHRVLEMDQSIAQMARLFKDSNAFFFVGRHLNYPVAMEGALKLKEISYVFSEAFAAGELKHGPLALITTNVPVIAIVTGSHVYDKMVSNLKEISTRDASIIAISSESDRSIRNLASFVIGIPDACEYTSPVLASIVLQLFSYYIALYRGRPIDKPRNLAKCVTVE